MSSLDTLERQNFIRRLFEGDASLWTQEPRRQALIQERLGWVSVHEDMAERAAELQEFADETVERGYRWVVLLGMGGSSLAPDVFQNVIGNAPGHPFLIVLDTTDPSSIIAAERTIDPGRTMFVVSSKSGTTIETITLYRYFAEKFRAGRGEVERLDNFAAITDQGTPLHRQAQRSGFGQIFLNPADIGGRYSALSYFGLAPAAAIGVDISRLLDRAAELETKPGVVLGATLADHWSGGRDKITFINPPGLDSFAAWVEQLLAESTGKEGKGLIPVTGEPVGPREVYGSDRVFVRLRTLDTPDGLENAVRALDQAGHPVITLTLRDPYDLGAEFLRWEMATAAAGTVIGINPFDEPNVAESKENTRLVMEEAARAGRVPEPEPVATVDGLPAYYDENAASRMGLRPDDLLRSLIEGLMDRQGDYFALHAYIQPAPEHDRLLREIRTIIRDSTRLATTVGYGPRFLHSTGQLHKGGPDKGVFMQLIADDPRDLPIPGEPAYGFGTLKRAQALGDLVALRNGGRKILRVHLGADAARGLERLLERMRNSVPSHSRSGGS